MTNYHQTVDELRSYCQASDQVLTEAMKESATGYREAALAVNARLRRCEEYLGKGLRSEALQLADADPPLLECLAVLDFPELKEWEQLAALYGLAAPPRLQTATAEAINRAYTEQEPLVQLLRQHRRLALCRAPLRERLEHLRVLQKADLGNPVWADDIGEWEKARLRQLDQEIGTVLTANDAEGIARTWTELQETSWVAGPPDEQLNRLRGLFLKQVAALIHDAVDGRNIERGIHARVKWRRLEPERALAANDPIMRRVTNNLAKLARLEEQQVKQLAFQDAIDQFEKAIAIVRDEEKLRAHWNALLKHRMTVPISVQDRYHALMGEVLGKRTYREKVILVSVFAAGAIAIVLLVLWLIFRPSFGRRALMGSNQIEFVPNANRKLSGVL